jgi:hypothetical protein
MNLDDLRRLIDNARKSAFRLETLPQYLVPQEADRLSAWQAGEPVSVRTPENTEWLARIQRDVANGFRWYRVHVLDQPLTEYLRYELWSYLASHAVGQEIYLVDRGDHAELADLHEDFWLYDDEVAVRMVYDADGRFLHPECVDDIEHYREMRDIALRHAEPLGDYFARNNLTAETLRMIR